MKKYLLIDDLRTPDMVMPGHFITESYTITVARSYEDGISALQRESWDVLYLDHDLGDKSAREMTGYDVICFIEMNPDLKPGKVVPVTSNPVGRQRINQVIAKLYGGAQR
jgi:hypothetical protein